MYMKSICLLTCLFLTVSAWGKSVEGLQSDSIVQTLKTEGFEDIQALQDSDTLYLSIEDRAHRGTFRGAVAAIKQVTEKHPDVQRVEMLLTDYKMPQLIVHAFKREGTWDISVDRQMERARQMLRDVKPQVASTGRIDITVFPIIRSIFPRLLHPHRTGVRRHTLEGSTSDTATRLSHPPQPRRGRDSALHSNRTSQPQPADPLHLTVADFRSGWLLPSRTCRRTGQGHLPCYAQP